MTKSTGVGRGVGGGRPPKYDEKRMLPVVRAMAKLGATDLEIAQALSVSLGAIELWARQHPKFLRALKPPKRAADDRVERSLFRRAVGYNHDSEEIYPYTYTEKKVGKEGEETLVISEKRVLRVPVVKQVPPDTTAAIFWLKNRRRATWKDYRAVEHSTEPGKPIEVQHGVGEPELIGDYYRRISHAAATASGAAAYPHPGSDTRVGEDRREPAKPRSGKGPLPR